MLYKLKPAYKDYLWGGHRLETEFGMKSGLPKTAEAWVLAAHKDGNSTFSIKGNQETTFANLLETQDVEQLFGAKAKGQSTCPLLIKFIDAKQNLSVQVHPNDAYAKAHENSLGKTECWYILDCDADAELIYGLKNEVTQEELERAIQDDTLLELANIVKVHKGDLFFIPAGTLHAIGKGILVAEIQQNSNITYRVYDYNRLGTDGKPRQLHKKQAAEVITKTPSPNSGKPLEALKTYEGYQKQLLTKCPLFQVERVIVQEKYVSVAGETSFVSLLSIDGFGKIETENESVSFQKGDSLFLSANSGSFTITGQVELLETRL